MIKADATKQHKLTSKAKLIDLFMSYTHHENPFKKICNTNRLVCMYMTYLVNSYFWINKIEKIIS